MSGVNDPLVYLLTYFIIVISSVVLQQRTLATPAVFYLINYLFVNKWATLRVCGVCLRGVSKFELIEGDVFKPAPLWNLQWPAILGAMGLGFCLSLLFFMDHNIAGAIVNSADNRCTTSTTCRQWVSSTLAKSKG